MPNFKPQVTYLTSESQHDYDVERIRVKSPYITKSFKTYTLLKKALKDYILHTNLTEDVFVTRSRRGSWGEWFERWVLVDGKPKIIKQGWQ